MTKGERIKRLREAARMTQEELARRLHTTKQTIYKYEKNIITNIPSDRIEALADILNSTPEHIVGWEVTKDIEKNSDAAVDLTVRLGDDIEFREVVKKIYADDDFFDLVKMMCKLDSEQTASIRSMLRSFSK